MSKKIDGFERLWLNKRQAAFALGICVRTLEARMKDGTVPYSKIGHAVRFNADDIRNLPRKAA